MVDSELHTLALYYGDQRDLNFWQAIIDSLNPDEWLAAIDWELAYVGRYMHQSINYMENEIPFPRLRGFVELVSELIKNENSPIASRHETNWT